MNPPRAAYVTLKTSSPNITVKALLGADGARVTGGYGGWTVVDRPRRQGVTLWGGRDPFKLALSIVLDGFIDNDPIEIPCSSLERMALPPNDESEPPVINLSGAAVPHDDLEWVIDTIEWGDVIRRADGLRLRQEAVVNLIRYNREERLRAQKASARARSKSKVAKKKVASSHGGGKQTHAVIYVVRAGDTLSKIAARHYGNATRWRDIADANNLRDPNYIQIGQRLRLP